MAPSGLNDPKFCMHQAFGMLIHRICMESVWPLASIHNLVTFWRSYIGQVLMSEHTHEHFDLQ